MTRRVPFLLTVGSPSAIVTGRAAAVLERQLDLAGLRVRTRGVDPEVSDVLEAIREAAEAWRGSAVGTTEAPEPEPPRTLSTWVTAAEAADLLGISSRAVRKAIAEGRLEAEQVGDRWRVAREDVEQFRARRTA